MRDRYQQENRFVNKTDAIATRARVARRHGTTNILDEMYDLQWAQQHIEGSAPNSYYDYFFGGTDVKIHVAELADDEEFGEIPIHNFAFNVEQEKSPVYGYWNYTYSAMMRGVRLITGQFTLVTRYPDYMKKLLTKAAVNRSNNHRSLVDDYPRPSAWREDDENIDRYWGKHIDPAARSQRGSEWSIHPPFSFVIVYGVQNTSLQSTLVGSRYAPYENDNTLLADNNQRLVESFNAGKSSRIVLDGCELINVQRSYSSDSPFLAEVYSFYARDIIVPTPSVGNRTGGGGTSSVR